MIFSSLPAVECETRCDTHRQAPQAAVPRECLASAPLVLKAPVEQPGGSSSAAAKRVRSQGWPVALFWLCGLFRLLLALPLIGVPESCSRRFVCENSS